MIGLPTLCATQCRGRTMLLFVIGKVRALESIGTSPTMFEFHLV